MLPTTFSGFILRLPRPRFFFGGLNLPLFVGSGFANFGFSVSTSVDPPKRTRHLAAVPRLPHLSPLVFSMLTKRQFVKSTSPWGGISAARASFARAALSASGNQTFADCSPSHSTYAAP